MSAPARQLMAARGPRGKAVQLEVWPPPKDGVWDWQRCYFAPGDRMRVVTSELEEFEAVIAAVWLNVYGRVGYTVIPKSRGRPEPERVDLEDLTGWRRLPIEYRYRQTERQLRARERGQHDTRLVFPRKPVGASRPGRLRP